MTTLVILPGLDGTGVLLESFVESIRRHFDRVVVIAYPTERKLDYAQLETLVRERLAEETRFVLLGESFSGPIALSIAASPPAPMVGLVLSATFARNPTPWLKHFASLTAFSPVHSLPTTLLAALLLGRWATPSLKSALHSALHSVTAPVLRHRAGIAIAADASASLTRISMPVLYLRASEDRLLHAAAGAYIASLVTHAIQRDVRGPHLLLQAKPEECAHIVADFASCLP